MIGYLANRALCLPSNRANHESGAFATLAVAKAAVQTKIPNGMSYEDAASLGTAIMTVVRDLPIHIHSSSYICISTNGRLCVKGQGMYKRLKLPLPSEPTRAPFPILIYGGSTATGMVGIQFAKLSGLQVITTCSPHNFELVKSFGADAVFDYKSETCAADIKELTQNRLLHSWDCTGDGASICAAAMSDAEPGVYGTIMPADYDIIPKTNPKVEGQVSFPATFLSPNQLFRELEDYFKGIITDFRIVDSPLCAGTTRRVRIISGSARYL